MLANAKLQTVICTTQAQLARTFYNEKLGLPLIGESDSALVFDVGGSELRVAPVPSHNPSEHTIVGFAVDDIEQKIQEMTRQGIVFERFDTMPHDANGIVTTPDGSRVAWLRDPDGNLLSVVQFRTRQ